jgi:hypothetical protein
MECWENTRAKKEPLPLKLIQQKWEDRRSEQVKLIEILFFQSLYQRKVISLTLGLLVVSWKNKNLVVRKIEMTQVVYWALATVEEVTTLINATHLAWPKLD